MDLPAYTGLTAGELRTAYNEVLDYLTLPGREFGTGAFPHSAEVRPISPTARCCST
jgi:hypothetical protein